MDKKRGLIIFIICFVITIILSIIIYSVYSEINNVISSDEKINKQNVNFSFEAVDTIINTKEKTLDEEIAKLTQKDNRRKNTSLSFDNYDNQTSSQDRQTAQNYEKFSSVEDLEFDLGKPTKKSNHSKTSRNTNNNSNISRNNSSRSSQNKSLISVTPTIVAPVQEIEQQTIKSQRISFNKKNSEQASTLNNENNKKSKISFNGKFFEDLKILGTGKEYGKIRVMNEFKIEGCFVRKNTIITAQVTKNRNNVEVIIQYIKACGKSIPIALRGYSLDGTPGLYVRNDNVTETGISEGGTAAIDEATDIVSSTTGGVGGIIGRALGVGISAATRKGINEKPILIEEGREMIFVADGN